jgi:hypothetical protein
MVVAEQVLSYLRICSKHLWLDFCNRYKIWEGRSKRQAPGRPVSMCYETIVNVLVTRNSRVDDQNCQF